MKPPQSRKAAKQAGTLLPDEPGEVNYTPTPAQLASEPDLTGAVIVCRNTSPWRSGFVDYINRASGVPARKLLGHMERIVIEAGAVATLPGDAIVEAHSAYITVSTGHGEHDSRRTARAKTD